MAAKKAAHIRRRPTAFIERSETTLKAVLDIARKLGCAWEDLLR